MTQSNLQLYYSLGVKGGNGSKVQQLAKACSGGSRISQMGASTPRIGVQTYYFGIFSQKELNEIERKYWTEKGMYVPIAHTPLWIRHCKLGYYVESFICFEIVLPNVNRER